MCLFEGHTLSFHAGGVPNKNRIRHAHKRQRSLSKKIYSSYDTNYIALMHYKTATLLLFLNKFGRLWKLILVLELKIRFLTDKSHVDVLTYAL